MNAVSSRSHCIFTLAVESRPHGSTTVRRSKLHLVDLAGSERVGKSGATGTTLNEAISINTSLFQLELVILALHEKQKASAKHVPYRNSMLTSVLRDSLGGNCKTVMIATVHPSIAHTDESISTCKFAQRVAMIKNEVSVNEEVDQAVLIHRLKEENRRLREAGGMGDEDATKQLGAEELGQLHRDVRDFLGNADPQATVQWGRGKRTAKVRHALWIIKGLLLEGWRPAHAPPADAWTGPPPPLLDPGEMQPASAGAGGSVSECAGQESRLEAHARDERRRDPRGAAGDGENGGRLSEAYDGEEPSSYGRAADGGPSDARDSDGGWAEAEECERREAELLCLAEDAPAVSAENERAALGTVERAYALFTSCYASGVALVRKHREVLHGLRGQISRAQAVGHTVRTARDSVASAKAAVEARRVSLAVASVLPSEDGGEDGGSSANAPTNGSPSQDAEEIRLCIELQQAKQHYHAAHSELKMLKQQCTALQGRADGLQAAGEAAFRAWLPLACARHQLPPPSLEGRIDTAGASSCDGATADATTRTTELPPAPLAWLPRPAASASDPTPPQPPVPAPLGMACSSSAPPSTSATSAAATSHSATSHSASAWLALLNEPEAALSEFRQSHWDPSKARNRDDLKRELNEAYSSAKEAGELVARKRAAASSLKEILSRSDPDELGMAGGEERLKAQLALETTLYKGGVANLKELKVEIETLQAKLELSQHRMQVDFQHWHSAALADARKRAAAAAATATAHQSTARGTPRTTPAGGPDMQARPGAGETTAAPAPSGPAVGLQLLGAGNGPAGLFIRSAPPRPPINAWGE